MHSKHFKCWTDAERWRQVDSRLILSAGSLLRPQVRHTPGSELLQGLERWGGSLKQDTVGFLFCLLLFHWRFPIYLSDQVIEDLRQHSKEEREFNRGVGVLSHDSNQSSAAELIDDPDRVLGKGLHLGVLTSRTLIFDLAEDSKKAQWFHCLARFWPCSFPTTRSSSKSHLFPTRIIGTWWRFNRQGVRGGSYHTQQISLQWSR